MSSLVAVYILMILAIISALFALEFRNIMVSVISLIVMNFFVWAVLLLYNAIVIAWVQLIVYGGGLTALFLVVVALTEKQKDETFSLTRTIIALVAIAVIVGLLIWAVIANQNSFNINTLSDPATFLRNLWVNRPTDIILQGVIYFVTTVAIGTLFIQHKKKQKNEEAKA